MDVLLMPYEKTVRVNSENLNTAKYCSPLKMFDYLASKKNYYFIEFEWNFRNFKRSI